MTPATAISPPRAPERSAKNDPGAPTPLAAAALNVGPGALLTWTRRARRFAEATWLRQAPPQRFATPNQVLHETPAHRLRLFGAALDAHLRRPPVLIVPPEVNPSTIVDFAPDQSLVRTALEAGFPSVGVIEWRSATPETRSRDIDDSVTDILDAIDRLGGRAHLVGVCQGGWESALAAAIRPEAATTLTLVAAPIDFHAGHGPLRQLTRTLPMAAYQALVATGHGQMPGELISFGFDALLPVERFWLQPLSVWNHLEDAGWLARYHQLQDWYRAPKDLPGPLYLRAVRELFKENRLVAGRFVCLDERVDLGRITCPLCLVVGERDHITPPAQLLEAQPRFGSRRVLEVRTDGGHIGTFMGRRELRDRWPGILAWLDQEARDREG